MAQVKREGRLENRTARKALAPRHAPYWMTLEQGRALGYRKGKKGGTWLARLYTPGQAKEFIFEALGAADDFSDPDGAMVLSFAQAQERARAWFPKAFLQATGEAVESAALTVREVVERYLLDRARAGAATASRVRWDFAAWVLPDLGEMEARRLTRKRIEDWMAKVSESPTRRRGGKVGPLPSTEEQRRARRASANRMWTYFRAALNLQANEGLLDASAWEGVRPFKGVEKARLRFLSQAEQVRLVNGCAAEDFRRLVQAALFTGAREGELARLEARDFDGANGLLFIEKSKSGKARHIVLTEEGWAFFREITAGLDPRARIFPRTSYSRMREDRRIRGEWSRAEIMRLMRKTCDEAKLEPLVFHELRHTYASGLINMGVSLPFVASQLGHRDTKMVEKHYGHLCPSAKAETVRRLAPRLEIFQAQGVRELKLG